MKRRIDNAMKVLVVDVGGSHVKCITVGWSTADEGDRHDSAADEAAA